MTPEEYIQDLVLAFEGVINEAQTQQDRANGKPTGMRVPFHGDFCSAARFPSIVVDMKRWAQKGREVLDEVKKDKP